MPSVCICYRSKESSCPIVCVPAKGGVGKSTITCNLAAISANHGLRTLVIDLDPQGNSTSYLLGSAAEDQPVAGFFEHSLSYSFKSTPPTNFVVETPFENLDLMPSSPALNGLRVRLSRAKKSTSCIEHCSSSVKPTTAFTSTPFAARTFYPLSAHWRHGFTPDSV